jgi:hypothetical protein
MTDRITIRTTPEIEAALDRFIEAANLKISRQEAFRQIISNWLSDQGYFEQANRAKVSKRAPRSPTAA